MLEVVAAIVYSEIERLGYGPRQLDFYISPMGERLGLLHSRSNIEVVDKRRRIWKVDIVSTSSLKTSLRKSSSE